MGPELSSVQPPNDKLVLTSAADVDPSDLTVL